MSTLNTMNIETGNKDLSVLNKESTENVSKTDESSQNIKTKNNKPFKLFHIILIVVGITIVVAVAIIVTIVIVKNNNKNEEKNKNKEGEEIEESEEKEESEENERSEENEKNIEIEENEKFVENEGIEENEGNEENEKIVENEKNEENEKNVENEENEKIVENEKKEENEQADKNTFYKMKENNYLKTTMSEDFVIPSDGKLQVVGANFQHKNSTFIIGANNKTFTIDDNGAIKGVTKEDLPLYYSFNETITNGSYLFKDVNCFKTIDLSKMDTTKMIDVSHMFENSSFEEIYFGRENETDTSDSEDSRARTRYLDENSENATHEITDYIEEEEDSENATQEITEFYEEEEEDSESEKRKEYFDTTTIKSAAYTFMNCRNLKKIQFPPSFNVGKSASGMFKGCSKLEEVNTTLISSTEIEEMDSMFEDCQSLKEIGFSNDFLTGEIKSLNNVFRNTNLMTLDISYLRLYNLESFSNIFEGASIKGTLKIGKYYSNNNTRDNLFKEIARVTDSSTEVYTPGGTEINQIFENIYYSQTNIHITVKIIEIDYNIHYKEDENYKLYSNYLHVGLGWDYDPSNRYDLDSSIVAFDYNISYLDRVNYQQLEAYNGNISLNGDDVTGEGDGDDEEIRIFLDKLPSEVQIFTVQLNSYTFNTLKYVKSAYIRLSTETEVIGTYSINQAGENIGLLIGCFSKSASNKWSFKPLNKVIPGHIVTESVTSIQEILHLIFDNKLISYEEFINRLILVADSASVYSQKPKYNSLYWNGTHWFADCSNLIKSIINGRDVYNPEIGSYQNKFPVVEDVNANNLILKCNDISNDFSKLGSGLPRLLHLKDNKGNGHVGVYLGQNLTTSKGRVNVIESTTSWGAKAIIYSWVDYDGTRRFNEGGRLSEMKYNWTSHGSLDKWLL